MSDSQNVVTGWSFVYQDGYGTFAVVSPDRRALHAIARKLGIKLNTRGIQPIRLCKATIRAARKADWGGVMKPI